MSYQKRRERYGPVGYFDAHRCDRMRRAGLIFASFLPRRRMFVRYAVRSSTLTLTSCVTTDRLSGGAGKLSRNFRHLLRTIAAWFPPIL